MKSQASEFIIAQKRLQMICLWSLTVDKSVLVLLDLSAAVIIYFIIAIRACCRYYRYCAAVISIIYI